MKGPAVKKLFKKDAPTKKERLKKFALKSEKTMDNHPILVTAIALATTNVVSYGILGIVANREVIAASLGRS